MSFLGGSLPDNVAIDRSISTVAYASNKISLTKKHCVARTNIRAKIVATKVADIGKKNELVWPGFGYFRTADI